MTNRLLDLRRRLCHQGFTLEECGKLWVTDNGGPTKRNVRHEFKDLDAVEVWLKMLEATDGDTLQT